MAVARIQYGVRGVIGAYSMKTNTCHNANLSNKYTDKIFIGLY